MCVVCVRSVCVAPIYQKASPMNSLFSLQLRFLQPESNKKADVVIDIGFSRSIVTDHSASINLAFRVSYSATEISPLSSIALAFSNLAVASSDCPDCTGT